VIWCCSFCFVGLYSLDCEGDAQAQTGSDGDIFATAQSLLSAQDYGPAQQELRRLLRSGQLGPAQLVVVHRELAKCSAALRQPDNARQAYVHTLALDPEFVVAADQSPLVREPYEAAAAYWQGRDRPSYRYQPPAEFPASEPAVIRPEVDDGGIPALFSRQTLYLRMTDGSYHPREGQDGQFTLPAEELTGSTELVFFLALNDEHGNRAAQLGSAEAPFHVALTATEGDDNRQVTRRQWYRTWWFWTTVGVVVVGLSLGLSVGLTRNREPNVESCNDAFGAACDVEASPSF
jgi:hypothetical protein